MGIKRVCGVRSWRRVISDRASAKVLLVTRLGLWRSVLIDRQAWEGLGKLRRHLFLLGWLLIRVKCERHLGISFLCVDKMPFAAHQFGR